MNYCELTITGEANGLSTNQQITRLANNSKTYHILNQMDTINAAQSEFFMDHFDVILQVKPLVFQPVLFS
jgi:hypothetical protein